MGRIKSLMVKKAARQLLAVHTGFNESFSDNKRILGGKTMPSKPIRNKVAGYISRLTKAKRKEAEREARKISLPKPEVQEEALQADMY